MQKKMRQLIEEEDRKNPWTDEELSVQLHMVREQVTQLRKAAGIPDSRERRKRHLMDAIQEEWNKTPWISERKMTERINQAGFQVGKYVIGKYMKEMDLPKMSFETEIGKIGKSRVKGEKNEKEIENTSQDQRKKEEETITVFCQFIGWDGSMSNQIRRAQAAVLYPPNGIHTLIFGPSGVGKSYLAELMYQYARTTDNFRENMPFYQFNCADYAENPQLLLAQLFGYCKGAFTVAKEEKRGIVDQCDGGILFLDEVHRLPPEGQEILFYLMDKGRYRRLGEVDVQRESHVMVIAATTENPESSLLLTFRRRIPMDIEIPAVSERPWSEKLELIKDNFMRECQRLKKKLVVDGRVIEALMKQDYPGNVGQLKSNIQVCCAKAFLEYKTVEDQEIHIEREIKNRR